MSFLDENKQNKTEASEEMVQEVSNSSEELTELEDLLNDTEINGPADIDMERFEPTIHFEVADILNALEHRTPVEEETEASTESEELEEPVEPEAAEEETVTEDISEPAEPEESEELDETEVVTVSEVPEEETGPEDIETPIELEVPEVSEDSEVPTVPEEPTVSVESEAPEEQTEPEVPEELEASAEVAAPEDTAESENAHENILSRFRGQDTKTKKLVLTDIILFAVIAVSIVAGLIAANSLVNKANAANETKIAEKQANIKEVNLTESLYDLAADQVIEDVAVPTYTLDELYALDLREPTGFTAKDLAMITRKGLVGCEEAFVEAEETYGVNCIFLMSIASLESAYGTQMFRPNNMFGYGRTGFSSKQEGIMTVAKGLGTRYLNPSGSLYGGSPTLKGVNKRYAANPQWYYKVGKYMQGYYAELASEKNGALDKFE